MAREYSHLTLSDRRTIALLKDQKVGVREIARRLGRHHSTISRESCRNAHRSDEIDLYGYWPVTAEHAARRRRSATMRLVREPALAARVTDGLSLSVVARADLRAAAA